MMKYIKKRTAPFGEVAQPKHREGGENLININAKTVGFPVAGTQLDATNVTEKYKGLFTVKVVGYKMHKVIYLSGNQNIIDLLMVMCLNIL